MLRQLVVINFDSINLNNDTDYSTDIQNRIFNVLEEDINRYHKDAQPQELKLGEISKDVEVAAHNFNFLVTNYNNIIIKFGRYIPNQGTHFDKVLGVKLASDNQYALKFGEKA